MREQEPKSQLSEADRVRPGAISALLLEVLQAGPDAGFGWDRALKPGGVIGRFELVREIGRGGFGVVWEARDRTLMRSVAFKALTLGPRRHLDEERLLQEAEAAARLSHPNIVTLHDVGRDEEHGPYLILELLRGATLARRLEQGRLSTAEGVRIGVEVARGLAHAHAHGVVHRDLTPGNVFLCEGGPVKLLDLGLAHAFGRPKVSGGTPAYMAPEQWRDAPEDERTDVFALGVLLYRMLSGELPFPEDEGKSLLADRRPPALEVPAAPGLGDLVACMLARDPVSRPRNASEALAALAAFQEEVGRSGRGGDAAPARARRLGARWRIAGLVAAGVLIGALTAGLWARRDRDRAARPPPSLAVLPFADLSPEKDQEYLSDGIAEEILSVLSRVQGLRLTGRTSSFSFKGKGADLRTIGEKLHVDSLLEGSVRTDGNRVRVTAQLVNAADGYRIWSENYDRELNGVIALEDDIAHAVAAALEVKLRPGESPKRRTPSPEVHKLVLLTKHLTHQGTPEALRRAFELTERAVDLDPDCALAWARLSVAIINAGSLYSRRTDERAMMRRGLQAAEKAVALDSELTDAYLQRGQSRMHAGDWEGARADLDRAVALDSGSVDAREARALLLAVTGRVGEAIPAMLLALEQDPLDSLGWGTLANMYLVQGRADLARGAQRHAREIAPSSEFLFRDEALVSLAEGHAARALSTVANLDDDDLWKAMLTAMAEHDLGHAEESERALDVILASGSSYTGLYAASVHAWRGERDSAFAILERLPDDDLGDLGGLRFEPAFLRLRDDPRYDKLLERAHFPHN